MRIFCNQYYICFIKIVFSHQQFHFWMENFFNILQINVQFWHIHLSITHNQVQFILKKLLIYSIFSPCIFNHLVFLYLHILYVLVIIFIFLLKEQIFPFLLQNLLLVYLQTFLILFQIPFFLYVLFRIIPTLISLNLPIFFSINGLFHYIIGLLVQLSPPYKLSKQPINPQIILHKFFFLDRNLILHLSFLRAIFLVLLHLFGKIDFIDFYFGMCGQKLGLSFVRRVQISVFVNVFV
ncbi:hypothetical protein IMG5_165440 [Ichthyophthirius multifiliis]|uniref:Transmembrane protein n=1 Tax=Ichthyophthirius multifiliis TaxID=5932 RepID=G0R0L3_ICHMU|nr:hypothetical protein IMG5_165440 [Ichthyophthirius multifiliis]EGR28999.1 hypothetical protein IMG5_165440 [Ichthyophthirius multifiliis]|eukprot:XP_004030235.1 hypothetical protein IMG5_165440 [Ichthyophthirius multifiliis]